MTAEVKRVLEILAVASILSASPATAQSSSGTVHSHPPRTADSTASSDAGSVPTRPTEADVRFMQGMIPHHAQALDMTALVPTRTSRRDVLLLAERIEVSQKDEIAWMQRWLRDHGESMPDLDAHHGHHGAERHALMPGMLTPDEMDQLAAATGSAFDRLFLQFMIRHHEGALVMVRDLLASPGAAQASEVYRFASDVDADQRADIQRMLGMLDAPLLPSPDRP